MPTNAILPYGTTLGYCATQAGTYVLVAGVREVTPPELNANKADITHLTSPNQTREEQPSWRLPGEASFIFLMTRSQYSSLSTIWNVLPRPLYFWHITLPTETGDTTASVLEFQARLAGLSIQTISAANDDPVTVRCTFATVGGLVFTPGTV